jgi:RimJ/RimL family protein N-acetyltransferase
MREIIFTHECNEHGRLIDREVWLMEFSIENLRQLWEKSKEHRILFSDDINGDFHKFCTVFLSQTPSRDISANGLVWVVDEFVGILFMSNIRKRDALLHFSFFDGRLRRDISARMIEYLFDTYDLDRLSAEIVPFASKRVFNFVESLGFKQEGRKRKALIYKNEPFDIVQYGLLREEFEAKWDMKQRQLVEVQLQD